MFGREVRVDTGVSISVLSVDEGEIKTLNGDIPILELEIELYAGDKDDMIALGRKLEEKYHLKRGNRSKFQCRFGTFRLCIKPFFFLQANFYEKHDNFFTLGVIRVIIVRIIRGFNTFRRIYFNESNIYFKR